MEKTDPTLPLRKEPSNYLDVLYRLLRRARVAPEDRAVIEEMANGGNPRGGNTNPDFKGVRVEYYPDWTDEDFKRLLADFDDSMSLPDGYGEALNKFVVPRFMSADDRKIFQEMADGGNPKHSESNPDAKSIREELYPEWKDDDFKRFLADFDYAMEQLAKEDNK